MKSGAYAVRLPGPVVLSLVVCVSTIAQSDSDLERIREATARNLLTIDVSIDGKVDRFVVDTGATSTLIVNRPVTGAAPAVVVGGAGSSRCQAETASFSHATIGDIPFDSADAIAADLKPLERFARRTIPGVAGGRIFQRGVLELDYQRRSASFLENGRFEGDTRVPLSALGGLCCSLQTTLVVGGRRLAGTFIIDTGAPGFDVVLTRAATKKAGLEGGARTISVPGLCAMSTVAAVAAPADLLLDDRALPVTVFVSSDRAGSLAEANFDGIIGGGVLSRFERVVIDARSRALWLRMPSSR